MYCHSMKITISVGLTVSFHSWHDLNESQILLVNHLSSIYQGALYLHYRHGVKACLSISWGPSVFTVFH